MSLKRHRGCKNKNVLTPPVVSLTFSRSLSLVPCGFLILKVFRKQILLLSRNLIIQVRESEIFTYDFCMTSWLFSTCLKLRLCGCSHSSLLFFLRHLLGDIDSAKSEGKFLMFLTCFFSIDDTLNILRSIQVPLFKIVMQNSYSHA